ncbi:DUF4278 domain-containing protein [Almyronema epifaneia]|uniref:DUF4278 domain-containing protein n=1 Tax=Almyronema epifaneia S1 TaxID=2991925 RepID=A0ABW6ILQ2_9CYAN
MELLILLAIAFAVFTACSILLTGILVAPWIIVVGVLLLGLLAIQWLSLQSNSQLPVVPDTSLKPTVPMPPTDQQSPAKKQAADLVYRGVHYKIHPSHPPQKTNQTEISGVYRGHPWGKTIKNEPATNNLDQSTTNQSKSTPELTYRGAKIKPKYSESDA